jgi:phosphoribosylanthranilate isomerase
MVRIKVCGITSLEDAMVCVEAGADALGFIFVEGTPRFVTPTEVAPIVRALPPFVTPVGVFWNHPAGHVKGGGRGCELRVSIHGDESGAWRGYALP